LTVGRDVPATASAAMDGPVVATTTSPQQAGAAATQQVLSITR
jgi:hypothetical protein